MIIGNREFDTEKNPGSHSVFPLHKYVPSSETLCCQSSFVFSLMFVLFFVRICSPTGYSFANFSVQPVALST